jgi:hypothetical protein
MSFFLISSSSFLSSTLGVGVTGIDLIGDSLLDTDTGIEGAVSYTQHILIIAPHYINLPSLQHTPL